MKTLSLFRRPLTRGAPGRRPGSPYVKAGSVHNVSSPLWLNYSKNLCIRETTYSMVHSKCRYLKVRQQRASITTILIYVLILLMNFRLNTIKCPSNGSWIIFVFFTFLLIPLNDIGLRWSWDVNIVRVKTKKSRASIILISEAKIDYWRLWLASGRTSILNF